MVYPVFEVTEPVNALLIVTVFCTLVFVQPLLFHTCTEYFPEALFQLPGLMNNLFNNPLMVQLIHRSVAYLLFFTVVFFFFITGRQSKSGVFNNLRRSLLMLIFCQVILGIFTLLHAASPNVLLWLGVSHQLVGMLVAANVVALLFLVKPSGTAS